MKKVFPLLFITIIFSCSSSNYITDDIIWDEELYADSATWHFERIMPMSGIVEESKSVQGMAVWDSIAFVLNHGGYCRIVNLNKKLVLDTLKLASYGANNHANNVTWGNQFYDATDNYPLLYITPGGLPRRCYVERYNEDNHCFELVQTIFEKTPSIQQTTSAFLTDPQLGYLYQFVPREYPDGTDVIRKYLLPDITQSEITLTEDDILEEFLLPLSTRTYQGNLIFNNVFYLLYGTGNSSSPPGLCLINLIDHSYRLISLTKFFSFEPESLGLYSNHLILNTNGSGIYYLYHFGKNQRIEE